MANDVWFSIPSRPLGKADVQFKVWRQGRMHGTLDVSKGTLVWFPRKTGYGYRIGWHKLHELMLEHATSFEKRR